jgi:hypothetical protein
MWLVIQWEIFIEITGIAVLLLTAMTVASILIVRNLRKTYKEVYRFQSKFDIELRKTANLLSKVVVEDGFAKYLNAVIKEMPYEDKKALLDLIDETFPKIDPQDPNNKYVVETFENLQEIRRTLDSKVLSFNHSLSLFPFNLFAKILKMKKMPHYTHQ